MSQPATPDEAAAGSPRKPLSLAPVAVTVRRLPGGGMLLASREALRPYPRCLGELLRAWAAAAPDRTFLAERDERDERGGRDDRRQWHHIGYGAALAAVERIAGALLARGLGPDPPVAILSEKGLDNGPLGPAAIAASIPAA